MEKRNLILRDYQLPASDHVLNTPICVLAICPNGGKTEVTIHVLERYLAQNPTHKVIILCHSQCVLLDNFFNRLNEINVSFTYSDNFDPKAQVHLCLPQNSRQFKDKEYDVLVVDEAHDNYFAKRNQDIIKQVKPTKQILLTGTPSKFIKEGGYDIYVVAANEINDKYCTKLNVELIASDYDWHGNYNKKGDEVIDTFEFKKENTRKTMDNVVVACIERLKTKLKPDEFNNQTIFTKVKKSWIKVFHRMGKTIVVCKTIEQADVVQQSLIEHGVNSVKSHSECDIDSKLVQDFKDDKHNVLVVVNRARLGYSDDTLMNVIDISGTHNPNIIYQMMMRATRGKPDTEKFYLKLATKDPVRLALTEIYTSIALMLTDKGFLSAYNGDDINNIELPLLVQPKKTSLTEKDIADGWKIVKEKGKRPLVYKLPPFLPDVINSWASSLHNLDNDGIVIVKWTSIGRTKEYLGLADGTQRYYSYEVCKSSALGNS